MEETVNEVEPNESFKSPPRRRRSTFFERRESIVPQTQNENYDRNTSKMDTDDHIITKEMNRYYEQLLSEKEQWKEEVKNRRHKYHDLKSQYQMALKTPSGSRMCYSALTNEDIEFLQGKTNISKLVDTQKKLHQSVKLVAALYKRANELDDVILDHCERKVKKITDHIFENSTIEPME